MLKSIACSNGQFFKGAVVKCYERRKIIHWLLIWLCLIIDEESLQIVVLFLYVKIFSETYWQNVIKCYAINITVNNSEEENYEYNNK